MRKVKNPLYSDPQFYALNGSCAVEAISHYFGCDFIAAKRAFKVSGYDFKRGNGLTFHQCNRVIETASLIMGKRVLYTSNKKRISVDQFLKQNSKGHFIVNQDGHVSLVKNRVVIDYHNPKNFKLLGWWQIFNSKKEYEAALSKKIMKDNPVVQTAKFIITHARPEDSFLEIGRRIHQSLLEGGLRGGRCTAIQSMPAPCGL